MFYNGVFVSLHFSQHFSTFHIRKSCSMQGDRKSNNWIWIWFLMISYVHFVSDFKREEKHVWTFILASVEEMKLFTTISILDFPCWLAPQEMSTVLLLFLHLRFNTANLSQFKNKQIFFFTFCHWNDYCVLLNSNREKDKIISQYVNCVKCD